MDGEPHLLSPLPHLRRVPVAKVRQHGDHIDDRIAGVEPVGIGKEIPLETGIGGKARQEVELRAIDPRDGRVLARCRQRALVELELQQRRILEHGEGPLVRVGHERHALVVKDAGRLPGEQVGDRADVRRLGEQGLSESEIVAVASYVRRFFEGEGGR